MAEMTMAKSRLESYIVEIESRAEYYESKGDDTTAKICRNLLRTLRARLEEKENSHE